MTRRELWTPNRRDLLRMLGVGGAAVGASSLLAACGLGTGGGDTATDNGAAEVTGGFDWRKAEGTEISVLQTPHPYQVAFQPLLAEFTELTGITVRADLVAEADYFTRLNTELASGAGQLRRLHDRRLLHLDLRASRVDGGPQAVAGEQLGHQRRLRLRGHLRGPAHARRRWDFKVGSPLGTGGQWAIPWGFETNVLCYNKAEFDRRGIQPAETFDDLIQLATDLTDRANNKYGIAFRGSRSWATIHPGFMTQFTREGCKDYELQGEELTAAMNSPEAVDFTQKWVELARSAGPTSWTNYEYPDCTGDLGAGTAMMVYDADSRHLPAEHRRQQRAGGQPRLAPGSGRAGRQLRHQPVDLVAGHELGVAEEARGVAVHPVGHRQGRPGQGRADRPGGLRRPHPRRRSSTARSSRPSAASPATRRRSRR